MFFTGQKLLAQPGLTYRSISSKTKEASKIPKVVGNYTDSLLTMYNSAQFSGGYVLMTKPHFDMFINKYFSYLSTSTVGLPNGNSISLQPTTNSTRLEGNISHKSTYTIYNVGVKADFSNNIANLFSAKDVTGNTSFYANISFLNTGKSLIEFNANTAQSFNDKKAFTVQNYNSSLLIKYGISYANDSLTYYKIKHRLDSIIAVQQAVATDSNAYKIVLTRDSMYTAMTKLAAYSLNERDAYYSVEGHMDDITKQLTDSIQAIVDTMEVNNPAWISFKFCWFSAGLTYTRPQYKTYNQALAFVSRLDDLTFNNTALTLGYNSIFQRSDSYLNVMKKRFLKALYVNAAYTIANDLNFSHIDPQDFQAITRADSSNTSYQFQETAKVLDISGKTKQVDWMHTLGLQTTWVIARGNFMGINTGLTGTYSKFAKPNYFGKLGFLFRFLNSVDQKSIINFELFLSLPDWEDSKGKGTSTWQRKSVGINATVPFNKLFF
jgi:hypothetical protein